LKLLVLAGHRISLWFDEGSGRGGGVRVQVRASEKREAGAVEVISGTVFWSVRWDNLPACSTGRAVVAEGAIEVDETRV